MSRPRTTIQQLRRIPAFRSLTRGQLSELLDGAAHRELKAGEVLYRQEQPAATCFVLLSGWVRFTVKLRRRNTVSDLAAPNELFGLESLRRRRKRPETATAVNAVRVLEIDNEFLKPLLMANSDFQMDLLEYVVDKLNEKSTHALRTGHYDAEQRIAAYLISHAREGSPLGQAGARTLSQADLADYLALTPETFCRKLGKFRRLGWIGGSGKEYVIKEHDALRELLEQ